MAPNEAHTLAMHLLESHDRARMLDPAALAASAALEMPGAEQIAGAIVAQRLARAERAIGYKIGFTNRALWPIYRVDAPIWGPVYDTTVHPLDGASAMLRAERFVQPRLEPEIVFGLASRPADTSIAALCESIGWIAHGFELVQCVYPDWRFSAAQAFAAQSLHGALLIGPRRERARAPTGVALATALSGLQLSIERFDDDAWTPIAAGAGAGVLDGPVQALGHLVGELARRGVTLAAGDIITTGTLTDAQAISPGQRWRTRIDGFDGLSGLVLDVD